MSVVILLLFVNAFYFTKWLFRHFYIQKIIRLFSGQEKITYETLKLWKSCQGKILTAKDKLKMKEAAEGLKQNASKAGMPMAGRPGMPMAGQTMGRRS